ncbi:hypothetical protein IAR55_001823 [Kwoniella newhampshirensis]|uniref:SUN domain-containing protein n=1 Tax=Kwoniella newhampshirensis TaxID=1651941 RepID=A0AAW0Z348_9TREE
MRARIPLPLVQLSLLLSLTSATTNATTTSLATTPSSSSASQPPPSTSTVLDTGITLWDLGFSLRDQWEELRDDEECPVSPIGPPEIAEPTELGSPQIPQVDDASPPAVESELSGAAKTPTDDTFVSFEEWKRINLAEEDEDEDENEETVDSVSETISTTKASNGTEKVQSTTTLIPSDKEQGESPQQQVPYTSQSLAASSKSKSHTSSSSSTSQSASQQQQQQQPSSSPPPPALHNRYNYASPDCSARIHSSSPQTQHASSLLHKSRDRYMLTPCKAKEHWVVVELCDEIRIEALEVAVWEFFSGVVREVRVSVGGEDDEEDEGGDVEVKGRSNKWTEVGAFVGKNIRGTFTLSQPTSFHRFVRLDFPSYFGTEYYCPVSQLKVYGMNQMEAFKWEQKRSSAGTKEKDRNGNREKEQEERRAKERSDRERKEKEEKERQYQREKELDALEKLLHEQAGRVVPEILTETAILSSIEETTLIATPEPTPPVPSVNGSELSNATIQSNQMPSIYSSTANQSAPVVKSSPESTTPPPSSTYSRSPPPRSDSSESIYAFIIRRLNALEGNSTLVARYIEEQAKVMRLMLTRVERGWDDWRADRESEDRARWEQERMRQEDRLGKVISQLEQQRVANDHERRAIQSQLRVLADELGYERRRGIAQLIIMLVIIVLGVVTRSSTMDAVLKPLLAEARRRKSIYGRKSISGPLTGLRIDMGLGRPPAVIGQDRPKSPEPYNDHLQSPDHDHHELEKHRRDSASSPTPTTRVRTLSKVNSASRRPGTPNAHRQRRQPSIVIPNFRSVSATVIERPYSPSSPHHGQNITTILHSPRPRASLPPPRPGGGGPPRRIARSAHLHTMEADKVRERAGQDTKNYQHHIKRSSLIEPIISSSSSQIDIGGEDTPKRRNRVPVTGQQSHQVHFPTTINGSNGEDDDISPHTKLVDTTQVPDALPIEDVEDGQEGWGTETETETEGEASASEVEDVMDGRVTARAAQVREEGEKQREEMIAELEEIWSQDQRPI